MAEVRIKDMDEHEIDTILAEDIDFEGRLSFTKPLMIKGKFKGEIKSTSSLYIGEKAYVEATTEADVVSSRGRHKGDILGHSRVELFSTAHVDGDITTPDFVVESGCKFNGYCNMSGVPAPARAAEPVAPPRAEAPAAPAAAPLAATQAAAQVPPRGGAEQHGHAAVQPQPQRPAPPQAGPAPRPPGPPAQPGGSEGQRGGGQR